MCNYIFSIVTANATNALVRAVFPCKIVLYKCVNEIVSGGPIISTERPLATKKIRVQVINFSYDARRNVRSSLGVLSDRMNDCVMVRLAKSSGKSTIAPGRLFFFELCVQSCTSYIFSQRSLALLSVLVTKLPLGEHLTVVLITYP